MKRFKEYVSEKEVFESLSQTDLSRHEFNKILREKLTPEAYKELNEKFDKINEVIGVDNSSEFGDFTFTAWVCGYLFTGGGFGLAGILPIVGITGGIGAAGAGVFFLAKWLFKRNKKKKVTEYAENYKAEYIAGYKLAFVDFPKAIEEAAKKKGEELSDEEIEKIGKEFLKKKDLTKQKCKAIEDECNAFVKDMTWKGGKNDPELCNWRDQEFNRVKIEALNEIAGDVDDEEMKAKIEDMVEGLEEENKQLKECRFDEEIKAGDMIIVSSEYYEERKEMLDKIYDAEELKTEKVKLTAKYASKDWKKFLKAEGIDEKESQKYFPVTLGEETNDNEMSFEDFKKKADDGEALLWYNDCAYVKYSEEELREIKVKTFDAFKDKVDKSCSDGISEKNVLDFVAVNSGFLKEKAMKSKNKEVIEALREISLLNVDKEVDVDKAHKKLPFKLIVAAAKQKGEGEERDKWAEEIYKGLISKVDTIKDKKAKNKLKDQIKEIFGDGGGAITDKAEDFDDDFEKVSKEYKKKVDYIIDELKNEDE